MSEQRTDTSGGASVGGDANAGRDVVGRDRIDVHIEPQPQPLPASHPLRQYALADVVAALIGDPLTGQHGLVADVAEVRREVAEMRRNLYPRWFQILLVVMALVLIVLLLLLLMRMH